MSINSPFELSGEERLPSNSSRAIFGGGKGLLPDLDQGTETSSGADSLVEEELVGCLYEGEITPVGGKVGFRNLKQSSLIELAFVGNV